MLKVAIFYDWLNQWGGAEKVLLSILKIYPQSDIYTLVHDPKKTKWLPPSHKIFTSFINKLPCSKNNPIFYAPFYALALEQFDFSQYDIVISTTSTIGHCLLTQPKTLFVCYYHNINRHLYSHQLLSFYQKIDKIYARRPDFNFCNSKTVQNRILSTFGKKSTVINPGINTSFFVPKPSLRKYFLVVSRLVPHKRIDLAILACQKLKQKLIIIGSGRQEKYLKKISNSQYVKFAGSVNDLQLLNYYQHATALICPQVEDYGLTPLESMACGTPIIAFNDGGIKETVINYKTGLFFDHQTVDSLINCLKLFSKTKLNPKVIRQHSLKYSENQFMLHFKKELDTLWQQHQNT